MAAFRKLAAHMLAYDDAAVREHRSRGFDNEQQDLPPNVHVGV
jgi:hypothetical protein